MPGTGFKRIAAKWRSDLDKIVDLPHAFVKQQMVSTDSQRRLTYPNLRSSNSPFFSPFFICARDPGVWIVFPVLHFRVPGRRRED